MGHSGEIVLTTQQCKISGIMPGDPIIISARVGELIIRKNLSPVEIFKLPKIAQRTLKEYEQNIKDEISFGMKEKLYCYFEIRSLKSFIDSSCAKISSRPSSITKVIGCFDFLAAFIKRKVEGWSIDEKLK